MCLSYLDESEQGSVLSVPICLIILCLPTDTFEIVVVVSVEGRYDLTDNDEIIDVCHRALFYS